jgi:hypothetical protein
MFPYGDADDNDESELENKWEEAAFAVEFLAPKVCKCDPDGISLYFFSNIFKKYENVSSSEEVMALFHDEENQIGGF